MQENKLGNLFGFTGGNYAGNVYDPKHLCPAMNSMQGGYRQPMIVEKTIVAQRGRDTTNPNHRGPANENYQQRLEPRTDGCTNCITSVQKDNLLIEVKTEDEFDPEWVWELDGQLYEIKIRKLTPLECWRLMGCSDEDFRKAEEVNSNTQLYKQAGNSIVVDVLCALFEQLI